MDHEPGSQPDDERLTAERSAADPTEGVRIIGAEEAAEAMERGDVAPRRGGDEPRFGDRPPPPMGPRPALRFPLDVSTDVTRIERPSVQPPPTPATGPVELPHWTEPPTGEVPQVLTGDDSPLIKETEDDLDAWSSFATSAPRWRDADDAWDEDDTRFVANLAHDDETRVGALEDPDARPTDDEFFSFHDLAQQAEERTSRPSGTSDAGGPREEPGKAPPWAAVPDAEDFHDSAAHDEGDLAEPQWAPEEGERHVIAAAAASVGPTGGVYDGAHDDPGGHGAAGDESPGRSTRLTRRKARRAREKRPGDAGGRDVGTAVVVGVLLIAVFAALMYIGPGWAMILVTLVVFLAGGEFFDALRRAGFESATLFGIVACASFPLAVYWRGLAAFPLLSVLAVVGCLLWFLAGAGGPEARVIEGTGTTILGIAWVGGLGSFAAAMLRAPDGRALLIIAAVATVAYDVGGFFVGRNTGRHPLSGASPNKTIEGLAGGMGLCVVATLVAVGLAKLGPYTGLRAGLLLGVSAAIAAPLGDLCQSLVKRDLGVKDMSAILPGHGGVFDRFDALLFVLPTIYYAVTIVGHRI